MRCALRSAWPTLACALATSVVSLPAIAGSPACLGNDADVALNEADALLARGRLDDARLAAMCASDAGLARGDRAAVAGAHVVDGDVASLRGDYLGARDSFSEAISYAQTSGDFAAEARAHARQAVTLASMDPTDESAANEIGVAVGLAELTADPEVMQSTRVAEARMKLLQGDPAAAAIEAADAFRPLIAPEAAAEAAVVLAQALIGIGDPSGALKAAGEAIPLLRSAPNVGLVTELSVARAIAHAEVGEEPSARDAAKVALDGARALPSLPLEARGLIADGIVRQAGGDTVAAAASFSQALEIDRRIKLLPYLATDAYLVGSAYHRLGDWSNSATYFAEAERDAKRAADRATEAIAALGSAEAALGTGRVSRVQAERASHLLVEVVHEPLRMRADLLVGMALLGEREFGDAVREFTELEARARSLQAIASTAAGLRALAEAHREYEAGDVASALDQFARARDRIDAWPTGVSPAVLAWTSCVSDRLESRLALAAGERALTTGHPALAREYAIRARAASEALAACPDQDVASRNRAADADDLEDRAIGEASTRGPGRDGPVPSAVVHARWWDSLLFDGLEFPSRISPGSTGWIHFAVALPESAPSPLECLGFSWNSYGDTADRWPSGRVCFSDRDRDADVRIPFRFAAESVRSGPIELRILRGDAVLAEETSIGSRMGRASVHVVVDAQTGALGDPEANPPAHSRGPLEVETVFWGLSTGTWIAFFTFLFGAGIAPSVLQWLARRAGRAG